jgi:threonine dehydratase
MGIQVPEGQAAAFQGFLDDLGLTHSEETGNPAYGLFLH